MRFQLDEWLNHLARGVLDARFMTALRSLLSFFRPYFRPSSVLGALAVTAVVACSGANDDAIDDRVVPVPAADPNDPPSDPPRARPDASQPDASTKDAPPDGPFDYCTAQAARYEACFPRKPFSPAECKKTEACLRAVYHPDLDVEGYLRCTSKSCSGGGMTCLSYIDDHQNDVAFEVHLRACADRRMECGDLGPLQFEDACSPFALLGLKDDVLALRATCLALPCDQIRACMEGKLREYCSL